MEIESTDTPHTRLEACSVATARRVAAMLDLSQDGIDGGRQLPRGWHFIMMGADTRRSELRADGFPGLGAPLPDLGLPRLLQTGRSVTYHHDIPLGATVTRTSGVVDVIEKNGVSGRKAVVKVSHSLRLAENTEPAITETQTYLLLPAQPAPRMAAQEAPVELTHPTGRKKIVRPDETLLFQYSALGFNSHRIHLDRDYARDVEGFPDLVVNGGLTTLLLTEFARRDLALNLSSFTIKNVAPLFCGRAITLAADGSGAQWSLKAYDDTGRVAAEMEAEVDEL